MLPRFLTLLENNPSGLRKYLDRLQKECDNKTPVIGFTGTGGAGKSSLLDELIRRILIDNPGISLAVLSVDPSKRKTGGALLGDRIRMNSIYHRDVFMRSFATRQSHRTLSRAMPDILCVMQSAGFDLLFLESSGIGQSNTEIVDYSDLSVYVMTPEYGAASQLEKIDMLDYADLVVVNKFDRQGGLDALRDVKKQVQRNRLAFDRDPTDMPVFGTIASTFNDAGVEQLYHALMDAIAEDNQEVEVPSEEVFYKGLKPLRHICHWTEGIWNFMDGRQRNWNEVQNTPKDIQMLAMHLLTQYQGRRLA